jgi:GAF domain-containing protein/anti-sigma regulatory factor (Ser/Thr protein kinase)
VRHTGLVTRDTGHDAEGLPPPDVTETEKIALERTQLRRAARAATERTEALQRVTASLSAAATAQDVIDVAIQLGLATIGASGGSIAFPVRGSASLHRVTAGYSPEDALSTWVEVPIDAALPGPQAARSGVSVWLGDRTAAENEFPLLREVFAHTPWRSLCALPLPIGKRTGFFVAFFAEPRDFDADARSFVETIVGLCGQALERADLLDAAEVARDRARRLQAVTAALSAAATPAEVGDVIVDAGLRATDAEAALVYVREGDVAKLAVQAGYAEDVVAGWEAIPSSADVPVWHVLRSGETLVIDSAEDAKRRFPALASTPTGAPGRPSIIAPFASGAVVGALCATYAAERGIVPDDVAFVETVGRLYGQALDRSRLLESERVAADRLGRLQSVTALLAGAMTVQEVARIMVHEGVAALDGAAGALVLVDDDGMLETVEAIGYGNEVLELYRRFAPDDPVVAAQVFASGRPRWVESLAEMEATYATRELELDPHLQAEAYIPLISAQQTIGVLLVSFEGSRRLTDDEKTLFLTLGHQCVQALVNARAYERQARIAEELQRSLLPAELPAPEAIACAVRYLPGSTEADVGGDWYDLVAVGEGRFGGGVGDVGGKGVLAASQMGQLRIALRAHTLEGLSPAAVLERLDALVKAGTELFATVVAFDVDVATGVCRYSSAGHPPPALVRPDGTVELLEEAGSVPLGVGVSPRYTEATVHVDAEETLFFYTDGLVERPTQPFDEGLERLRASLAAHARAEPPDLVDAVLDDLVSADDRPDDIAVLALRLAPAESERFTGRYPLEPTMLVGLRADLRRWLRGTDAPRSAVEEIVLATSEAVANAIEHAETPAQQDVEVELSRKGREIVVVVQDFGTWREPGAESDRGRGFVLMRALMDDVAVESARRGTRVTMRRRISEAVGV